MTLCVGECAWVCVLLLTFTFKDVSLEKQATAKLDNYMLQNWNNRRIEREERNKEVYQLKGLWTNDHMLVKGSYMLANPCTTAFCGLYKLCRRVGVYMSSNPLNASMRKSRIYVCMRCILQLLFIYNMQCNNITDIILLNHIVSKYNHATDCTVYYIVLRA